MHPWTLSRLCQGVQSPAKECPISLDVLATASIDTKRNASHAILLDSEGTQLDFEKIA